MPTPSCASCRWPEIPRLVAGMDWRVESRGIPHLPKPGRYPDFLYAALDKTACAPFSKERRMKCVEPNRLNRKSGIWGTQGSITHGEVATKRLR
jgi:hypothetical protein